MNPRSGPRATRLIDIAMVLCIAGVGALFLAQGLHLASEHPTSQFAAAAEEAAPAGPVAQKSRTVR